MNAKTTTEEDLDACATAPTQTMSDDPRVNRVTDSLGYAWQSQPVDCILANGIPRSEAQSQVRTQLGAASLLESDSGLVLPSRSNGQFSCRSERHQAGRNSSLSKDNTR